MLSSVYPSSPFSKFTTVLYIKICYQSALRIPFLIPVPLKNCPSKIWFWGYTLKSNKLCLTADELSAQVSRQCKICHTVFGWRTEEMAKHNPNKPLFWKKFKNVAQTHSDTFLPEITAEYNLCCNAISDSLLQQLMHACRDLKSDFHFRNLAPLPLKYYAFLSEEDIRTSFKKNSDDQYVLKVLIAKCVEFPSYKHSVLRCFRGKKSVYILWWKI